MSNSHRYHFFFHDDFGVIRSKMNIFFWGKVCLVVASGGHVPLLPPLGSGTESSWGFDVFSCFLTELLLADFFPLKSLNTYTALKSASTLG